jgi:hypothetical protein
MLLHKKVLIWCLLMLAIHSGMAQVDIDKQVIFTSPFDSLNRIDNLSRIDSLNVPLRMNEQVENSYRYFETTNLSTISVTTGLNLPSYQNGMLVHLKYNGVNQSAVYLNLDGLGPVQIVKNGSALDSADISNDLLSLVYIDQKFEWINRQKKCPKGYKKVKDFCIEINENPPQVTMFQAMNACKNKNAKLCTWNQWYTACSTNDGSLQNMTGNWEWLDEIHDHDNNGATVGGTTCTSMISRTNTLLFYYRCCRDLK